MEDNPSSNANSLSAREEISQPLLTEPEGSLTYHTTSHH